MKDIIAICPGSFDPITLGHLDIITRASAMFSKVIVVVLDNASKRATFSKEERVNMIKIATSHLKNIEADFYSGLLADYIDEKNARAIIKGLRAVSDFEYEFQMALINEKLNPKAETVFLTTKAENLYLSSSVVKSIAALGGDIRDFVPDSIHDIIKKGIDKEKQK